VNEGSQKSYLMVKNPDPVLGSQNLGLYLGVLGTIQANSGIASNQVEAGNREKWKVSL
jgi:hypothetical protein